MKEITVATEDSSLFLRIVILSLAVNYDSNSVQKKSLGENVNGGDFS